MAVFFAMAKKNLFDPRSNKPFPLSRSKVELFESCPRCFYLDRRLGISRPPGFPFNLNSAVDALLKKEFDACRVKEEPHPYMVQAHIHAVPHSHEQLETWRSNFKGIRVHHQPTNLELYGAIDDLWRDLDTGELIVVDYKATSKMAEVTLDDEWQISYKRQMAFYQWLLRQSGFTVSKRGWFVYCNGRRDLDAFNDRIEFRVKLISHDANTDWIEPTIAQIHAVLMHDHPPAAPDSGCDFCTFAAQSSNA